MSQDVQSKFKAVKSKFRINMGVQTRQSRKKASSVWYHLIRVCLLLFRTYATMSKQHVRDFKLIYHLSSFAGGSVNDLKLCSYSCVLSDYSIDMLKKDAQMRANGLSRY